MWFGSTRLGIRAEERMYDCSRHLIAESRFRGAMTGAGVALFQQEVTVLESSRGKR